MSHGADLAVLRGVYDDCTQRELNGGSLVDTFKQSRLKALITYLKKTPYKGGATMTWEHTTLLVFSELARTPLLNGRAGRDHHLASSCLVAGPGIKGNQIFGATSDNAMVVHNVDPATGKPDDAAGIQLRPADIHATLLHSMGLSYDHLSNQSPQMLSALLVKP